MPIRGTRHNFTQGDETMKSLTAKESKERGEIIVTLRDKADALSNAVEAFNDLVAREQERISEALRQYNEAVAEANEFRDIILTNMDDYFSDRSEKWQYSDSGSEFSSWMEEWRSEFEEESIDLPDPIEIPSCDAADLLESLTESIEP